MKRKIFMTGGTGFFGKSILSMLKRGFFPEYEFTVLSRNPGEFCRNNPEFAGLPQVEFISGDVRDFSFPRRHYDCVFHAGAPAKAMPEGVERDIILRGTERMLQFARHCGAEKFLFVSSGAVYGPLTAAETPVAESHVCHPVTEYGIAKLEAEEMCLASGLFTLLPRCFAFTGRYLDRNIHFAVGNFIRDALQGETIVIKGDGTPLRSYLYADDLARWLFAVLEKGKNGVPYNVGSDKSVSIAGLANLVAETLNTSCRIKVCGTPEPGQAVSSYVPDVSLIRKTLGVEITTDLRDAILLSAGL